MMAPDTTILSANARAAVGVDANGAGFPWAGVSEPKWVVGGGQGRAAQPGLLCGKP
jgi:hypothetical protein